MDPMKEYETLEQYVERVAPNLSPIERQVEIANLREEIRIAGDAYAARKENYGDRFLSLVFARIERLKDDRLPGK